VPVDGRTVTSATTLVRGRLYILRASGTFYIGAALPIGDAEYAYNPTTYALQQHCGSVPSGVALGLGVDDPAPQSVKVPFWGPFNLAHVYTIGFIGRGAPIRLTYHDCYYPDNVGALTVRIYRG
jgi:hypothetical protein